MEVDRINKVLIISVHDGILTDDFRGFGSQKAVIVTIVNGNEHGHNLGVHHGILLPFQQRMGHMCNDTIIKMARLSASGVRLTAFRRINCLLRAKGKQTINVHSLKNSSLNSTIDVIDCVLFDPKDPMNSHDRLGNKYLIKFIDHRSKYCRVFLEKTKDNAAMKLIPS